jgi:hypothetical protein
MTVVLMLLLAACSDGGPSPAVPCSTQDVAPQVLRLVQPDTPVMAQQ